MTTATPRRREGNPRRARPHALAPNHRAGVWRVERDLGKGGMAAVYAVVHARFGKRAALKLAHRSILSERFTAETFWREARIANLIDHPSVPDVFATGTYDGRPYLVMERLGGRTLGDLLEAGAIDRVQALEILITLCDVLAAAHRAGVVHRDLKLDNVFVLDAPGGGRAIKLLDWGVAAVLGEPDPMRGLIAGTLTYVAPEQVRGDEITPAADVYSLAVLAYRLLLGRPPFQSRNDRELIQMHVREAPPSPESLWPQIPRDLSSLLTTMLAKLPGDRPLLPAIVAVLERTKRALSAGPPRVRRAWRLPFRPGPFQPAIDLLGRTALGIAIGVAALITAMRAWW